MVQRSQRAEARSIACHGVLRPIRSIAVIVWKYLGEIERTRERCCN